MESPYLNLSEAAQYARCSTMTLRRAGKDGKLTLYKHAGLHTTREDIDAWIGSCAVARAVDPRIKHAAVLPYMQKRKTAGAR